MIKKVKFIVYALAIVGSIIISDILVFIIIVVIIILIASDKDNNGIKIRWKL
jgi:hypothetical protein